MKVLVSVSLMGRVEIAGQEMLMLAPKIRTSAWRDGFLPANSHPKLSEAAQHCHEGYWMPPGTLVRLHLGYLGAAVSESGVQGSQTLKKT